MAELTRDAQRYRLARDNGLCSTCRKADSTIGVMCDKCRELAYQRRCLKFPRRRKNYCGNCFREGHNARTCRLTETEGALARERAVELAENLARIKGEK